MADADIARPAAEPAAGPMASSDLGLVQGMLAALVAGGALAVAGWAGSLALLVAVAAVQAAFALAWAYGTGVPGPRPIVVTGALSAGGADVAVSLFPHGRLGALLVVAALAIPVLFTQQLLRGAARTQVAGSLSAAAVLVFAELGLAALMQTRHEFSVTLGRSVSGAGGTAGHVVAAVAASLGAAVVVGCLVDMVVTVPRLDPRVPRGFPGVLASGAVGAAVGYLLLRAVDGFGGAAGLFAGAALGVLAGLLAVAGAFVQFTTPIRVVAHRRTRRLARAVGAALLPLCLLAPVGFLLTLAVRT